MSSTLLKLCAWVQAASDNGLGVQTLEGLLSGDQAKDQAKASINEAQSPWTPCSHGGPGLGGLSESVPMRTQEENGPYFLTRASHGIS